MSILNKLSTLTKVNSETAPKRVAMTETQVKQCKAAITRDNRGYNVHPNKFDIAVPYRVAVNFNNEWFGYGNFTSADVAAAVGAIVSSAYFGDDAVIGSFDSEVVEGHEEFQSWLANSENADVIAKANQENTVDDSAPF